MPRKKFAALPLAPAAQIAFERAQTHQHLVQSQQAIAGIQAGPIDLFKVFGIDVEREKLYTRQPDSVADKNMGLYWALPTVDQDARAKAWDVRICFIGPGGVPKLAYWFQQGDPKTPNAMAGVTLMLRSDGALILTMTEDIGGKALFPPMVFVLNPVG